MCLNSGQRLNAICILLGVGWVATTWPGESLTNADFITWRALRGSVPPLVLQVFEARKNPWNSVKQPIESGLKSRCPELQTREGDLDEWISRLYFYLLTLSIFLAKTAFKLIKATIIFWTHRLIESHPRLKIILFKSNW